MTEETKKELSKIHANTQSRKITTKMAKEIENDKGKVKE